jgi:hypothetical protein
LEKPLKHKGEVMGTRADFYVGRGEKAEWIGSIAWDGYPTGLTPSSTLASNPQELPIFAARTEEEFKKAVSEFFEPRDDVTLPERGWPWPWDDSHTTDYAYMFENGQVFVSNFGSKWVTLEEYMEFQETYQKWDNGEIEGPEPELGHKEAEVPNMKDRQNVRLDGGSGLIVLGG